MGLGKSLPWKGKLLELGKSLPRKGKLLEPWLKELSSKVIN